MWRSIRVELAEGIADTGAEVYQQPLHSMLVLVDLTNTAMTKTSNQLLSDAIVDTKKYILRTAVVGLTGFRKVFLDYFGRLAASETEAFDDLESAKKWLVRDN